MGVGYSPAFEKIVSFDIGESNGETRAVVPYKKGSGKVEYKAENFDWLSPGAKIRFKDSFLTSLEGTLGYSMGGARVELEVGYERFKVSGPREEGSKGESEEGIYLLAKELAMNTVRDNTTRLGLGIGRLSKGDLKAFHAAFVAADAGLDGKVCKNGTDNEAEGEKAKKCEAGTTHGGLGKVYEDKGVAGKVSDEIGANIATSISKLSKEEKATLAGAFAKAVEGAVWEERG